MKDILKSLFLACLIVGALTSCTQQKPTVEEEVLIGAFTNIITAETYDKMCNSGEIVTKRPTKDLNINWYGNQQTIVALIAAPMRRRFPKDTPDKSLERILEIRGNIASKSQSLLEDRGCDSPEAIRMGKILDLYTKMPPWSLHSMILEEVKKRGGVMTELTEEEQKLPNPG